MNLPKYVTWFIKEDKVTLADGHPIECYLLDYKLDETIFQEWALYLRQHYESDEELVESLDVTGLTAEEYLRKFIIPQKNDGLGPTARSNDFTEIMTADIFEFIYGYTVPRCKQRNKSGKTLSEHGTDIIAYKFEKTDRNPNEKDELLAIEVKAGLTSDSYTPINKAVEDSQKYDEYRHAITLNYYRKKLEYTKNYEQAKEITRFQKKSEKDYKISYVAAAIISREKIHNNIILEVKGEDLELRQDNIVFLIHGSKLMELAHLVYERCIK